MIQPEQYGYSTDSTGRSTAWASRILNSLTKPPCACLTWLASDPGSFWQPDSSDFQFGLFTPGIVLVLDVSQAPVAVLLSVTPVTAFRFPPVRFQNSCHRAPYVVSVSFASLVRVLFVLFPVFCKKFPICRPNSKGRHAD